MSILIIDDNESITTMLAKFFKMEGIECVVSNSGRNGLEMIQKNSWKNILLDLTMPEFSGYDILDELENKDTGKIHNVIIFTATEISDVEIETWKSKGVKGVVRKPVDLDYLLKIIKE